MDRDKEGLRSLIDRIIPFKFLPREEKDLLLSHLFLIKAAPWQWIFRPGAQDREVFLLEEGQVEQVTSETPGVDPENVIRAGHYFGERSALLNQNRYAGVRALTNVRAWALPGHIFLDLIRKYTLFSQSFGSILRDKHGIFAPLDHFTTQIQQGLARGFLSIKRLVDLYLELDPALHPQASNPQVLNLDALLYAVRRLPSNVSTTFAWFLTDDLPSNVRDPDDFFPAVPSEARIRSIWQVAPGKNMVLLRNGLSDLTDLVSNLCLYAVEAQKLRIRVNHPDLLVQIREDLRQPEEVRRESGDLLDQGLLPFNEEEIAGLRRIWGSLAVQRLYELAVHHEDFLVMVERQINNYNNRRSETWAHQISRGTRELCGYDPNELPLDWEVHIISSNTHSVTNCLSPWWQERKSQVLAWGRESEHLLTQQTWKVEEDLFYALIPSYLKAHPQEKPTETQERAYGIYRLKDTAATGIAVQLIRTSLLAGERLDPGVPNPGDAPRLLVNIDYAFGEQADEIMRNLITLFYRNVKSISILGKAGALLGHRGDILVPTTIIQQSSDQFLPLDPPQQPALERLRGVLGRDRVHVGPLLTVEGTLLQNALLLHFYRHIWNCQGLEMEGFYYARQIQESRLLGVLPEGVRQSYYYYVSDTPLDTSNNLSKAMAPGEGIPPLYAITREVLGSCFQLNVR